MALPLRSFACQDTGVGRTRFFEASAIWLGQVHENVSTVFSCSL